MSPDLHSSPVGEIYTHSKKWWRQYDTILQVTLRLLISKCKYFRLGKHFRPQYVFCFFCLDMFLYFISFTSYNYIKAFIDYKPLTKVIYCRCLLFYHLCHYISNDVNMLYVVFGVNEACCGCLFFIVLFDFVGVVLAYVCFILILVFLKDSSYLVETWPYFFNIFFWGKKQNKKSLP